MTISQIDDYVAKGEQYWLMRFNNAKEDDPTTLAVKIQAEFVYFDVAFQSLMKKENREWKVMLKDFFDVTTGDVFATKTKISKDFYCKKIAKIHNNAITLKGFLLNHL